jgi:hypothetical protein
VVFVDSQVSCEKTLFNPILLCFKNVENFNYSIEIENTSALNFMSKIHNNSFFHNINGYSALIKKDS